LVETRLGYVENILHRLSIGFFLQRFACKDVLFIFPSHFKNGPFRRKYYTYCTVYSRCYATIARRIIRCSVAAGKHVNNIRAIARKPPITTTGKLLKTVFSVGSAPRLYSKDPRPAELELRKFSYGIFAGEGGPEREELKDIHC
jgi:hypothetical protein